MRDSAALAETLERLDGRGYKAYREIEGVWSFAEFTLFVDRVQSDPFAAPSKLRVRIDLDTAALPDSVLDNPTRRLAAASWLARRFRRAIRHAAPRRMGTGKGGLISIDAGGPEILERTCVVFDATTRACSDDRPTPSLGERFVEARIEVGLPAAGRRALGREASVLLVGTLAEIARTSWIDRTEEDDRDLVHFVHCVENQESVREQLRDRNLVAFIGEGALLPRESGASEAPMARENTLPFSVPSAFEVFFDVPHADAGAPGRRWRGMGLPKGVVLLVGGGYHGKSTLLRAIERGVVAHVPGDGRETVVSDPSLVKIRAEDGRSVAGVDIQPFVDRLPLRPGESAPRDTSTFSTADASGSTSQAANIAEAIEAGATGLLLDEDTSATNFMVRDARMQALIHPDDEPITPFLDRVRELYDELGVSTVLVMGGSGDYFAVADAVIEMKAYAAQDVTSRAQAIAAERHQEAAPSTERAPLGSFRRRIPLPATFDARRGRKDVKFSSRACEEIVYGTTEIDLRGLDQLFDASQTRAIAGALHVIDRTGWAGDHTVAEILDRLEAFFEKEGLDGLDPFHRRGKHPGALARPRRFEVAGALGRMRTLKVQSGP